MSTVGVGVPEPPAAQGEPEPASRRALVPHVMGRPISPGIVRAGRGVLRGYGKLTSPVRPLPDFLLIGAKRCGTTSFYFHLLRHPGVLPMFPSARFLPKARDGKGPHFFDSNYHRRLAWYRAHFPSLLTRRIAAASTSGPVVSGEASPYYLYHPLAAQRAARDVPGARLLVLLRDPVERAFSHYREQRRNGTETLGFAEALAAEDGRTRGEEGRLIDNPGAQSFAHEQQSYLRQGEYVAGLRRWLEQFPRAQLLVQPSELYYEDPERACRAAHAFLGLPATPAGSAPVLNAAPASPMAADLRRRLVEHYAPFNDELADLLGQRFSWSRP